MGVITDKTGLEIVGKIGDLNVDTSGLVKDTTAQETNNAIDALKSAVQGLGTALGADRALIDGSNIANPAVFRSNIGLQIDTFSFNGTPNSWFDIVTDCPLNGYVPLGFIGTSLSRSHWDYTFVYDGNTSSTYWAVRVASPVSTVSGTYSGSFLALKIN